MKKEFDFTGVPEKDVEELTNFLNQKIEYISSGRRDRDVLSRELETELLKWGRAFLKEISEKYGLKSHRSSYTYFEIENMLFQILIPYTNRDNFKSKNEFVVFIKNNRNVVIGKSSSVDETILIINDHIKNNKPIGSQNGSYQIEKIIYCSRDPAFT